MRGSFDFSLLLPVKDLSFQLLITRHTGNIYIA